MISNILFDLDNTLLDSQKSINNALSKALLSLNIVPTEQILQRHLEINAELWKSIEYDSSNRDRLRVERIRRLFSEFNINQSPYKAEISYEKFFSQECIIIEDTVSLLSKLHQSQYRLYIVSNGFGKIQRNRIKLAGIDKYFEAMFFSDEIGFDKPNPAFLKTVLVRFRISEKKKL